jgi:hypothetical protein
MKAWIAALFLIALPVAAGAASPDEQPRRQLIDLDRLLIEGRVPNPSTLFIRERLSDSCTELFPLRRRPPSGWLLPADKAVFDRETLDLVDQRKR